MIETNGQAREAANRETKLKAIIGATEALQVALLNARRHRRCKDGRKNKLEPEGTASTFVNGRLKVARQESPWELPWTCTPYPCSLLANRHHN